MDLLSINVYLDAMNEKGRAYFTIGALELSVENTLMTDLKSIFRLFDESIIYQEKHGVPTWKNYDQTAILRDIEGRHQYKVSAGEEIAIIFSVCYTDKIIWRQYEKGDSMYLHRIVVNPKFKGQRLFGVILQWAIERGKVLKLRSIRMDTWANNPRIIEYYKSFGFRLIENYTTPDTIALPVHNRNLPLSLLEFDII